MSRGVAWGFPSIWDLIAKKYSILQVVRHSGIIIKFTFKIGKTVQLQGIAESLLLIDFVCSRRQHISYQNKMLRTIPYFSNKLPEQVNSFCLPLCQFHNCAHTKSLLRHRKVEAPSDIRSLPRQRLGIYRQRFRKTLSIVPHLPES